MAQYEVIGIGVGPANLSLAALLHPHGITSLFLSEQKRFTWHEGFNPAESSLQVSFLKDLVTPVDPSSPFSFLSYLRHRGRLYSFIHAAFDRVSRAEFADYLTWVAGRLDNIHFKSRVEEVTFQGKGFSVRTATRTFHARDIVVGTGTIPNIPDWAPKNSRRVLHSGRYSEIRNSLVGARVCVVGGGQSGAEIVADLLSQECGGPRSIEWITRRSNLLPLDETAFTNEFFRPSYSMAFHRMSEWERRTALRSQRYAGYGVSPALLTRLYQLFYRARHLDAGAPDLRLRVGRTVSEIRKHDEHLEILLDDGAELAVCDTLLLCTGWRSALPSCMSLMAKCLEEHGLNTSGDLAVDEDFSVCWSKGKRNRIFVQNAAAHAYGIAETNLSLVAWRAAVIANALAGRAIYNTSDEALVDWPVPHSGAVRGEWDDEARAKCS